MERGKGREREREGEREGGREREREKDDQVTRTLNLPACALHTVPSHTHSLPTCTAQTT